MTDDRNTGDTCATQGCAGRSSPSQARTSLSHASCVASPRSRSNVVPSTRSSEAGRHYDTIPGIASAGHVLAGEGQVEHHPDCGEVGRRIGPDHDVHRQASLGTRLLIWWGSTSVAPASCMEGTTNPGLLLFSRYSNEMGTRSLGDGRASVRGEPVGPRCGLPDVDHGHDHGTVNVSTQGARYGSWQYPNRQGI